MSIYANIAPNPPYDGLVYASAARVPAAEGDVGNQTGKLAPPVPVLYGEACLAIVELSIVGTLTTNTTYIVMQTDLGDGTWIDLAWCTWTGITGVANFVLSGGVAGANSFLQRVSGVAPSPVNGDNQIPLGGRIRFVGKSSVTTTSSSSSARSSAPGVVPGVQVSILYKLLGLR